MLGLQAHIHNIVWFFDYIYYFAVSGGFKIA